jgi:hypothetical protein
MREETRDDTRCDGRGPYVDDETPIVRQGGAE